MTKSLAIEWTLFGIRVKEIAPGNVQTALTEQPVDLRRINLERVAQRRPCRRLAEGADAMRFLVSENTDFITSQVLVVDGGWTACGHVRRHVAEGVAR